MNRTNDTFLAAGLASTTLASLSASSEEQLGGKVRKLVYGHDLGIACTTMLRVGDTFLGATGHAAAAGLTPGSMEYRGFIIGFAASLPSTVVTNVDGVLLDYRK